MSKSDQQRVQHLTDENFDKEVLCSEIPVLNFQTRQKEKVL